MHGKDKINMLGKFLPASVHVHMANVNTGEECACCREITTLVGMMGWKVMHINFVGALQNIGLGFACPNILLWVFQTEYKSMESLFH